MSLNITRNPESGTAGTTSMKVGVGQHNGYADQTKKIKFTTEWGISSVAIVKQKGRPLFADLDESQWEGGVIPSTATTVNFVYTDTNFKTLTFSSYLTEHPGTNIINASLRVEIVCGDVTKVVNINPATLDEETVDLKPANAVDSHQCVIKVQVPANTGASRILAFNVYLDGDVTTTHTAYKEQISANSISLDVTELTIEAGDTTTKTVKVTSTAAWTATEI